MTIPKQVKIETLEESVEIIEEIIKEAANGGLSNKELLSLIRSIASLYSIILTDEEIDELSDLIKSTGS